MCTYLFLMNWFCKSSKDCCNRKFFVNYTVIGSDYKEGNFSLTCVSFGGTSSVQAKKIFDHTLQKNTPVTVVQPEMFADCIFYIQLL